MLVVVLLVLAASMTLLFLARAAGTRAAKPGDMTIFVRRRAENNPRISAMFGALCIGSSALLACVGSSTTTKPKTAEPTKAPVTGSVAPLTTGDAAPPKDLAARKALPLALRETLTASMDRHGEELVFLLSSVVLLHYQDAEELAQMIADEPKLGRPVPGDETSLNAMLPTGFFVYQDALTARAKELAAAARAKEDARLVKAFGALSETCVGCHSAYLNDDLSTLPDESPSEVY